MPFTADTPAGRSFLQSIAAKALLRLPPEKRIECVSVALAHAQARACRSRVCQDCTIPSAVWHAVGSDFVLVGFNSAMLDLSEGKLSDYLGTTLTDFAGHNPRVLRLYDRCRQTHGPVYDEYVHQFRTTGQRLQVANLLTWREPGAIHSHLYTSRFVFEFLTMHPEKIRIIGG